MSAARTVRAGLVGNGIGASLSPAMHMAEGAAQGLDYRYDRFDLAGGPAEGERLERVLRDAQAMGLSGLNVTHPYKQIAIAHVDVLSPDAEALGAINTIVFENDRRIGHNTDWSGYAEGFKRSLPGASLGAVVQLGAGGAGAAVAHALLRLGAGRLTLIERDKSRAQALGTALSAAYPDARIEIGDDPAAALVGADGLVNATPVGMAAYPGLPLPAALLRPDLWVSEIVYFPIETALLAEARLRGCATSDGGGMAVFQAVGAFRLFTGLDADAGRMLAHFQALTA